MGLVWAQEDSAVKKHQPTPNELRSYDADVHQIVMEALLESTLHPIFIHIDGIKDLHSNMSMGLKYVLAVFLFTHKWPGGQVPKAELTKTPRDEDDEEPLFPLELSSALDDVDGKWRKIHGYLGFFLIS